MGTADMGREMQKGSAEMIILALLVERARHGYELAKVIERQSENRLRFHVWTR
jgi:PadR family transcriptional regulator PadR